MNLNQLIENCRPSQIEGQSEKEVRSVQIDSRHVQQDDMFVALRGTQVDGHEYIGKAIEQGATVVACEVLPKELDGRVTYLVYSDTELAVGPLATACAGNPSRRMKLIGVTGTNGK
ncbi:MAG: Mur ligase domain-containing protein, partial [Bacteroidaceae bacterium]